MGLREEYSAQKRSSAALDFDDLLLNARDMLRDSPEVRDTLSKRYRYILVDEFQDTDPVQAEILFRLAGDGPVDADWWKIRSRPGQLCLVGDPKQSIYRFRRADIACYEQVRHAFSTQFPGSKIEITANFRSQEPILNFVNTRFAESLADIGFAPLVCTLKGASKKALCVNRLDVQRAAGIEEQRRAEASQVAQLCRNLFEEFQV